MTYSPKVSIVMPTFRRQHVLLRAVESILAQSYQNWELIVVNNELGGKLPLMLDSRIFVWQHTEETSAAYARNAGLAHAKGDLVCFFDDDDEMLPGYLGKMVQPFACPTVMIVRCGMAHPPGIDFSHATPEVWLRREHATATWQNGTYAQDQIYFQNIVRKHGWTGVHEVQLGEVLVRAYTEAKGGIREGAL